MTGPLARTSAQLRSGEEGWGQSGRSTMLPLLSTLLPSCRAYHGRTRDGGPNARVPSGRGGLERLGGRCSDRGRDTQYQQGQLGFVRAGDPVPAGSPPCGLADQSGTRVETDRPGPLANLERRQP